MLDEALCASAPATGSRSRRRSAAKSASWSSTPRNNAREALGRRLAESASQEKLLEALGEAFGLDKPPRRVEVYDNSHIMGTQAIGAMIVAGPAGFMKAHYRTFNIKGDDLTPGDDYGMMREVLRAPLLAPRSRRRSGRGRAERARRGGRLSAAAGPDPDRRRAGQFDAARADARRARRRRASPSPRSPRAPTATPGARPFSSPAASRSGCAPRDPALYFVQRLRDEAHRFAIGTHRARRKKEFTKSPLDEIAGIGPARKRALLHAFGTAKAMSAAALADLEKIAGRQCGDGPAGVSIIFMTSGG